MEELRAGTLCRLSLMEQHDFVQGETTAVRAETPISHYIMAVTAKTEHCGIFVIDKWGKCERFAPWGRRV